MKMNYLGDNVVIDLFNILGRYIVDSLKNLCKELFGQWSEQGAMIAATQGYERGMLDAAEGKLPCETLSYDIHKMFEGDYQRGYHEGYNHGNEQPEF